MGNRSEKLIANNKKAYHDYEILETYEAGIDLAGTEVKSMRMGKCSIKEAYVRIDDMQAFVYGMHISPYEKGNIFNRDPLRTRRLLLHKNQYVKVLIGVARGKKLYDKRRDIAKKDMKREAAREFKIRNID